MSNAYFSVTSSFQQQEKKIREFVFIHEDFLKVDLYRKIIERNFDCLKLDEFYSNMKKYMKMTLRRCKDLFEKYEESFYLKDLKIPKDHFEIYKWVRVAYDKKRNMSNRFYEKFLQRSVNKKWNKKREKLVEDIENGLVEGYGEIFFFLFIRLYKPNF